MKILSGIEKLELVKLIHEQMGVDFNDISVEEAFTMFREIEKAIMMDKDHEM